MACVTVRPLFCIICSVGAIRLASSRAPLPRVFPLRHPFPVFPMGSPRPERFNPGGAAVFPELSGQVAGIGQRLRRPQVSGPSASGAAPALTAADRCPQCVAAGGGAQPAPTGPKRCLTAVNVSGWRLARADLAPGRWQAVSNSTPVLPVHRGADR